jgi:recombinational DNA repair ATPase RecF
MLKSLQLKNLTVFAKADLRFSPQLNVVIGANGLGSRTC